MKDDPDDDDSFDDDEFEECGEPVMRGDEVVGYCVKWIGHVGQCANIILLK